VVQDSSLCATFYIST